MRSTEEIKNDLSRVTLPNDEQINFEILLDIRDLLIRLNRVLEKFP